MPTPHDDASTSQRLARARLSLDGLSIGDAFGDRFFTNPDVVEGLIDARAVPAAPWRYTDDTEMALSIVWGLRRFGRIEQEELAHSFARRYDRTRGYGPAMHGLLARIGSGEETWRAAARGLFEGQGSWGNGAAMRVPPLGAYFADDMDAAIANARLSAEITHAHPEGIAGAIAVTVAAARAWNLRDARPLPTRSEFLDLVLPHVPDSIVHEKIRHARNLDTGASVTLAVAALGNGVGVSAQDTVPFALWCTGAHLDNFEEALWLTVSGLGDRDTTCAIVGGIVALSAPADTVPASWLSAREPLPRWPFEDDDATP